MNAGDMVMIRFFWRGRSTKCFDVQGSFMTLFLQSTLTHGPSRSHETGSCLLANRLMNMTIQMQLTGRRWLGPFKAHGYEHFLNCGVLRAADLAGPYHFSKEPHPDDDCLITCRPTPRQHHFQRENLVVQKLAADEVGGLPSCRFN